jgi:hypothetical protein
MLASKIFPTLDERRQVKRYLDFFNGKVTMVKMDDGRIIYLGYHDRKSKPRKRL